MIFRPVAMQQGSRIKTFIMKVLHHFRRPSRCPVSPGEPECLELRISHRQFFTDGSFMALFSRLSLAATLYASFGLLAVLTAAIPVLPDYNSRHSAELTESIERANMAALNVERVNSLVYAVVMESRGVYMSTEPEVVKKFGDGL